MQYNIYSIDNWQPSTNYSKNYIVQNSGQYYYAFNNFISSSSINTDISNGNLFGYVYYLGANRPFFNWKPTYNFSNESQPRVKKIQFGDGYFQNIPDGINNLLLNYTFKFEGDLAQTTAILHFLTTRNGCESFCFLPPAPRGQISTFICPKWTDIQPFFNNYSIECNFQQVPI